MKINRIIVIALAALALTSCNDFLDKSPLDTVTDTEDFWNNEENIRTSIYTMYPTYFKGYNSGWSRSDYFSETEVADWNDDNAQEVNSDLHITFTKVAPTTTDDSEWNFDQVRAINVLIDRISNSSLADEAKNHWLGVARFLRAMEYSSLVEKFGDVPYFSEAISSTDYDNLYKERDPRETVMDNVLADLNFASENVRATDGTTGLSINRDVVNAFASRLMLFEGTWQKYREGNSDYAKKYLQAAVTFAQAVISTGSYSLCDDYKDITTSEDLAGNKEMILYRSYVEGVVTHSLMAFQNTEHEVASPSKDLVDSYLSANGLPIRQAENTQFKGDQWFSDEMADRDPRLYANVDTTGLRLSGAANVYATSGYFSVLFVNPDLVDVAGGRSNTCITDAPIMRYDEVLLNDIEAKAELAALGAYTLTQDDFDKTINVLRDRKSTSMPHVTYNGSNLSVGGVVINDPNRDSDVSPVLWEIRRERRVELVYSGLRFNDLRRWSKLDYADMTKNEDLNRGAWVDKARYVAWYNASHSQTITVESLSALNIDGNAGYITPLADRSLWRTVQDKDYLYPLPTDEITLYQSHGKTLTQNPGW